MEARVEIQYNLLIFTASSKTRKKKYIKKSNTFSKYLGTLVVSSLASPVVTICIPQPAQLAIHGICVRNAITGSPIAILGKITLWIHTLSTGSACY